MTPRVAVTWEIFDGDQIHAGIREFGVRRMARTVEVSPQTVANWMAGTPIPDAAMVRIAHALGLETPRVRAVDVKSPPGARHTRIHFHDGILRKLARLRGKRVYGAPRRLAQILSDGTVTSGGVE